MIKKKIKTIKILSGKDIGKSADIPSSLGLCIDELPQRYMAFEGQTRPKEKINSINRYRIDDMYEAVDY